MVELWLGWGFDKNDLNIKDRAAKGIGNVTKVLNILEKVTLGSHYYKTAILLRESIFLSALLTNAECWHNLTMSQINQLEAVDKLLLRKILKTQISTATESLYLELGILRIRTIIKARRLKFCQAQQKLKHSWAELSYIIAVDHPNIF